MLLFGFPHGALAQGVIAVSINVPSTAQPNTPVTITAQVTEDGNPKAGANVSFSIEGVTVASCDTDATGRCSINWQFGAGTYTVAASSGGASDSASIVVGTPASPTSPPPTRTPVPTQTNTPPPPTNTLAPTSTLTPLPGQDDRTTPTRTPFFFNPPRTPTATRTPTPLFIPSSTATSALFMSTPRITTPTAIPTRTPRPASSGPIFAFPTVGAGNEDNTQPGQPPLINLSTILSAVLVAALIVLIILIIANFRRFRRLLWRLFRF